jgi:hypothetical protein
MAEYNNTDKRRTKLYTVLLIFTCALIFLGNFLWQNSVETAVAKTLTSFPTITLVPSLTLPLPSPTVQPTIPPPTATPVRQDLGVPLEDMIKVFEGRGFSFQLRPAEKAGEISLIGYKDNATVILNAGYYNLVSVSYEVSYDALDYLEKHHLPSNGDIGKIVLGDEIYKQKIEPWLSSHSYGSSNYLCFEGILIYLSSDIDTSTSRIDIVLKQDWDIDLLPAECK